MLPLPQFSDAQDQNTKQTPVKHESKAKSPISYENEQNHDNLCRRQSVSLWSEKQCITTCDACTTKPVLYRYDKTGTSYDKTRFEKEMRFRRDLVGFLLWSKKFSSWQSFSRLHQKQFYFINALEISVSWFSMSKALVISHITLWLQ